MKQLSCWLIALVLGLGMLGAAACAPETGGDEKEVTLDQVPASVRATILKEAGTNTIDEIEKKTENGVTMYEAEWKVGGKEVEIKVTPDGKIVAREIEVTIDQVPAAVKATILKEAAGNKIEEIEAETKNGTTTYEAEWHEGDKEIEIKVAPDGTLLKKEIEDDDEDGDDDDDDDDDDD